MQWIKFLLICMCVAIYGYSSSFYAIGSTPSTNLDEKALQEHCVHRLHCGEPWFSFLREGIKPVEGRKNAPKYRNIKPGDTIEFYCDNASFRAKVTDIQFFASIEEYLRTVSLEKALPGIPTIADGVNIYSQWYMPEEVEHMGFLGIYIEPIPQ